MKFSSWAAPLVALSAIATGVAAEQVLLSNSLNSCQEDSQFTASLFRFSFTPSNRSASIDLVAFSSVQGYVSFDVDVAAYGFKITTVKLDPCKVGFAGLCPMNSGPINLPFSLGPKDISADAISQIPSIAYDFPDLDATIQIRVTMVETGKSVACVEANISNGKTVNLLGVKWALAVIAGLVLLSSAIINGLGHSNAATHVASGALSLFGFFQTQAILGLTAVHLPPVVQSWTQDFQWSIGIVNVGFMQNIFTWYQRSTGGTPSTLFDTATTASVRVLKRSMSGLWRRAATLLPSTASLVARDDSSQDTARSYIVSGIQRVAYKEGIEPTNLFITAFTSCYLAFLFTIILVLLSKGFCELAARAKWLKGDSFSDFRNTWKTHLRGILYRLTFISYPYMAILCFWELTRIDSPAEAVIAVCMLLVMSASLGWAAFKICRIARRSISMHKNPAYILFSDEHVLNKWGFLYIQYRASAYYFMIPVLGYILVKALLVAFAQGSGTAQAIGLLIIEAAALIAASVLRPWMDKSTNSVNIAICAVNFVNAVFLLMFSDIFGQPPIVNGVIGLVLFFLNAIFALVLLIMLIVTTTLIFFRKNPDARYQFMGDDRASFMKSNSQLSGTAELDALAATARGEKNGYKPALDLEDSASTSGSLRPRHDPSMDNLAHPATGSSRNLGRPPRSPVNPSTPFFPADEPHSSQIPPPSPLSDGPGASFRQHHNVSPAGSRNQPNASPWQRGAGYDH